MPCLLLVTALFNTHSVTLQTGGCFSDLHLKKSQVVPTLHLI